MLAPYRRLQTFYFVQFLSVGMANAYAGIWFASKGLSDVQIGSISAIPNAVLFCTMLLIGRLADRARDWRSTIILGMIGAGLLPVGLFWADGYWPIALLWAGMMICVRLTMPVADAAAVRFTKREGGDFAQLRGLTTVGYLAVVLVGGLVLAEGDMGLFLPLFVGFGLVRMMAALALPPLRSDADRAKARSFGGVPQLREAGFVLVLVGWALVDSTHFILNAFQGLLWAEAGISTQVIGALITLGAAAEAAMFFAFRARLAHIPPIRLLLVATGVALLRWTAMAFEPGLVVLAGLQLLHAITFAVGFLAITHFIADRTHEDHAAEAQSLMVMLNLAACAVAIFVFGWIADAFGAQAYFFSAALAATGGLIIWAQRS